MDRPNSSLFEVYLRLRPSDADRDRFLDVDRTSTIPTHITIKPPADDKRKRAIEKFGFTRVFEEDAGQLDLFHETGAVSMIEGVLGARGREGRDGLLATLGVTGSGKSHTILGSKSQRGLTQLTLDALFQHTAPYRAGPENAPSVFSSLCAADVSEAQLMPAARFLESIYEESNNGRQSRAPTPGLESSFVSVGGSSSRRHVPRVSALPQVPAIDDLDITVDDTAEYAIIVSMYEVYNDRIYDLLTAAATLGKMPQKRRALLFKNTELSPDRKVVAGLRKVVCTNLDEALLVLETGLHERRVAGTGSNAVSSRSHGFFSLEVKKRHRADIPGPWSGSSLTIVDLAGSERARTAKTAGATLAEAGKINESLMYLGQCMQMQADNANSANPSVVPFRQCKLTELLFSNSFAPTVGHRPPQKSAMVVTADPLGDFNATSQILRYSALAREVTVPRVPSITNQILAGTAAPPPPSNASAALQEELDHALAAIASLRADLDVTQLKLEDETRRRREAEVSWQAAEDRMYEMEAEVREEVWAEMEAQMALEQRRWRAARDEELDRHDEHMDRKLEVMARGIDIYEAPGADKENAEEDGGRVAELEDEVGMLREKLAAKEREKESQRSPSKKMRVLKTRRWDGSGMGVEETF
ncbi:hypothetical protein WHR41_01741 [Cladosporium halotolerans]|uniref:Kinesin-like protein n=1 Tax=Cladosporium halotolerans TaxID=1052096 RepID=A0AB34L1V3_9PEZI